MRKIVFGSAISLDGFVEGPEGELDWLALGTQSFDLTAFVSCFDTVFYGRRAYERFGIVEGAAELPDECRAWQWMIRQMRKYVFSRKEKHLPGNGMVVSENLEAEVRRIRGEEGKNIWLGGGPDILKTFVDLDLVDEYFLTVHPVLLRSGKRLFSPAQKPLQLELIDTIDLGSGVFALRFRPKNRTNNENNYGGSL